MKLKEYLTPTELQPQGHSFSCAHEIVNLIELIWTDLTFLLDRLYELQPSVQTESIKTVISFLKQEDGLASITDLFSSEQELDASILESFLSQAEKMLEYLKEPRYILKSTKSVVGDNAVVQSYLVDHEKTEEDWTQDRLTFTVFYQQFINRVLEHWDESPYVYVPIAHAQATHHITSKQNPKDIIITTLPETDEFSIGTFQLLNWKESMTTHMRDYPTYRNSDCLFSSIDQAFQIRETGPYRDDQNQLRMGYELPHWSQDRTENCLACFSHHTIRLRFEGQNPNVLVFTAILKFYERTLLSASEALDLILSLDPGHSDLLKGIAKGWFNISIIEQIYLQFQKQKTLPSLIQQLNLILANETIQKLFQDHHLLPHNLIPGVFYEPDLLDHLLQGLAYLNINFTFNHDNSTMIAFQACIAMARLLSLNDQIDMTIIYAKKIDTIYKCLKPSQQKQDEHANAYQVNLCMLAFFMEKSDTGVLSLTEKNIFFQQAIHTHQCFEQMTYHHLLCSNLALVSYVSFLIKIDQKPKALRMFKDLQDRREQLMPLYTGEPATIQPYYSLAHLDSEIEILQTLLRPAKRKEPEFALAFKKPCLEPEKATQSAAKEDSVPEDSTLEDIFS